MNLIALDFETHYDSRSNYTLGKMTTEEYIRDDRFEAIMVSIAPFDGRRFVPTNHIGAAIGPAPSISAFICAVERNR